MQESSRVEALNMRLSIRNTKPGNTFFVFLFGLLMHMILETRMWLSPCTAQTTATNFSVFYCNARDNATDPATFLANLDASHVQLRENLSSPASTGFATFQVVRSSVPMYAIFHCRGYTSRPGCLACLDSLFNLVADRCLPKFRATVFNDGCYLRYAVTNVFDRVVTRAQSGFCDSPIQAERWAGFNETASEALLEVERAVVGRGGRFVAGKKGAASGGGRAVYAAGECLPVLGLEDCRMCLESVLWNVRSCLPETGGRAVQPGCFVKYSGEEFFNGSSLVDLDRDSGGRSGARMIIIGTTIAVGGLCILLLFLFFYYRRYRKIKEWTFTGDIEGKAGLEALVSFTYDDLKAAARNFSDENKLGQGGFSSVYKGVLKNGKVVAIKKLSISGTAQARADFENEVILISNIRHRNLLSLLGCCRKGQDLLLVYELMERGSLDRYIFDGKRESLDWKKMFNIIVGSARGIAYLHEEFPHCIIHRDIKPGNILLDDEYQPKVADFGLARLLPDDKTHVSTKLAGTLGYTAPEYVLIGKLSEKVDVYSFGIVLLEILSGKRCNTRNEEGENSYLLHWAWGLYESDKLMDMVDKSILTDEVGEEEVKRVAEIGLMCTQSDSKRPAISDVVVLLLSEDRPKLVLTRPTFITMSSSTTSSHPATNAVMLSSHFSGR